VNDVSCRTGEAVFLPEGATLGIGRHTRLRFEHGPLASDGTPQWARFTRVDPYGGGQVHVQVIHEAIVSADPDAALRLEDRLVANESLHVVIRDGGLAWQRANGEHAPLRDGESLALGNASISVAVE
jgi:hypothetical protein